MSLYYKRNVFNLIQFPVQVFLIVFKIYRTLKIIVITIINTVSMSCLNIHQRTKILTFCMFLYQIKHSPILYSAVQSNAFSNWKDFFFILVVSFYREGVDLPPRYPTEFHMMGKIVNLNFKLTWFKFLTVCFKNESFKLTNVYNTCHK